jgi:hypothetical protein
MAPAKSEFFAHHIVAQTDRKNGCYLLGLADDAKDPEDYILFQRPFEFDDEAAEHGEDCHWFQYKKASLSAFGACTKARVFPDRLEIEISKKTKKIHTATGGKITVKFKPTPALSNKLRKYLELIL